YVGPAPATPSARPPPPATAPAAVGVAALSIDEAMKLIGRVVPQAIAPREVRIAQLVMGLPPFEAYHEVGLEYSVLPLLLSLLGREAAGIAIAEQQATTLRDACNILRREQPGVALRCELIGGRFPDAVMGRDPARSLAIVTNLVTDPANESFTMIVRGFARYA